MDQSTQNLTWYKSTLSGANTDNCVEVANLSSGGRAVRDSKDPSGPTLSFASGEWRAFISGVKSGEFDQR
ncbi:MULTISPECIES: DUF397 domain-containing protein [unclassified Streptosporangium]|uniref:DUF397 domain-containing protein n=1 Tax=Streptosporangium sp. NPDC005286 TaxID=3154463 RepID=UPI0033A4B1A1